MTVNPIDMQVLLPKIDSVNRVQRGLQNQQQVEQQVLGQEVKDTLLIKQQFVQELDSAENNGIKKENEQEKKKKNKMIYSNRKNDDENQEDCKEIKDKDTKKGNVLDVTI